MDISKIEEAARVAKMVEDVENVDLKDALNRALIKAVSSNGVQPKMPATKASRDRMFGMKPGSNRYVVLDTINHCASHNDPLSANDIHDLISDQVQLTQVQQACSALFAMGAIQRIQSTDLRGDGAQVMIYKYRPRDIN